MKLVSGLRQRLEAFTRKLVILYACWRDPATPWYARLVIAVTLAYFLSPVDLIPDFIPLLGQLDDLVLVSLGILLAVRLIPRPVWERHAAAGERRLDDPILSRTGLIMIGLAWLIGLVFIVKLVLG
jgi:uncharacterized membrane protein YkvA (DUF1232 family)